MPVRVCNNCKIKSVLVLNSNDLFSISPKVRKPSREKRSLASHLSGYIPPKRKQKQGSPLPTSSESLNCIEDKVLSTVSVLAFN